MPLSHRRPAKYRLLLKTPIQTNPSKIAGVNQMDGTFSYEVSPDQVIVSCRSENPWAIRNPLDEARDLHRMVTYGSCTIDSIRDLISVPPEIESALLAYAAHYPIDGQRIQCVLQFRRRVGAEFERLLLSPMSFSEASQPDSASDLSEIDQTTNESSVISDRHCISA